MLKRVIVNNKKVPVPVPVKTLADALAWIETTLVPPGHVMTRVALDERVLGDGEDDVPMAELAQTPMTPETKLEVQIDSPADLAVQTLDAMRNLAQVIGTGLKPLAVECWTTRGAAKPTELPGCENDLTLVLDLIDHVSGLMEASLTDCAALLGNATLLKKAAIGVSMARSNSDWKAVAKILLNKIEPLLKDLVEESESLQIRVLTSYGVPVQKQRAPTG